MAKQTFYGLRVHLVIAWPGVIVDFRLAPGNIHDVVVAKDLLTERVGWTLGDSNYWSPQLREECEEHGLCLLSPYKTRKGEQERKERGELRLWSGWLTQKRRRVETVIGQLTERYRAKKVWVKDAWHLWSRWLRTGARVSRIRCKRPSHVTGILSSNMMANRLSAAFQF
jgi:hypothetical protein